MGQHDDLEKQAARTPAIALPEGFGIQLNAPPLARQLQLHKINESTLCGGAFAVTWESGPWKGKPITGWCVEPNCIDTGVCSGAKFVPHLDQFTSVDPNDPTRRLRAIEPAEAIAFARWSARKATGKDDPRTDKAIARYVGEKWRKLMTALRGDGKWTPQG